MTLSKLFLRYHDLHHLNHHSPNRKNMVLSLIKNHSSVIPAYEHEHEKSFFFFFLEFFLFLIALNSFVIRGVLIIVRNSFLFFLQKHLCCYLCDMCICERKNFFFVKFAKEQDYTRRDRNLVRCQSSSCTWFSSLFNVLLFLTNVRTTELNERRRQRRK